MAYVKNTWSNGDTINATKLNNIETGVEMLDTSKEATSNKVTSLSASSTDTQYPSAKCVYDLIGSVENLLGSGVIS